VPAAAGAAVADGQVVVELEPADRPPA
jgi:hypothetical protein